MSISTKGFSGDKDVAKYLAKAMHLWGFNIIPGLRLTVAPGDQTKTQKNKIQKKFHTTVKQIQAIEKKARFPVPTWKDFMMFRVRRSVVVNSKINGMISMRDRVNSRLQDVEAEIRYEGLLHHRSHRPLI